MLTNDSIKNQLSLSGPSGDGWFLKLKKNHHQVHAIFVMLHYLIIITRYKSLLLSRHSKKKNKPRSQWNIFFTYIL